MATVRNEGLRVMFIAGVLLPLAIAFLGGCAPTPGNAVSPARPTPTAGIGGRGPDYSGQPLSTPTPPIPRRPELGTPGTRVFVGPGWDFDILKGTPLYDQPSIAQAGYDGGQYVGDTDERYAIEHAVFNPTGGYSGKTLWVGFCRVTKNAFNQLQSAWVWTPWNTDVTIIPNTDFKIDWGKDNLGLSIATVSPNKSPEGCPIDTMGKPIGFAKAK